MRIKRVTRGARRGYGERVTSDGQDTAPVCVEHVWRLVAVTFAKGGSFTEYSCPRCGSDLLVPPFGTHPETV